MFQPIRFSRKQRRKLTFLLLSFLIISIIFITTAIIVQAVPVLTATKTDALLIDNNTNNKADPGDTLRYTVIMTNSGTMDAVNVDFADTIDSNTTLVGGSVKTTPIARHDTYSAIGNVGISVPAASGALINDNDPDGGSVSVIPAAGGSASGGAFSISSNGSFSYLPPVGFEGADSFSYTVQDSDGNQDQATVFITVSDVIWFIDNSAGGGGTGHLSNPFNSIAAFNATAADDPGDVIFIYTGSGNYTSGLPLQNSQLLVGQGASASLASIAGITVPPHSNALPSTGGTHPVLTNNSGNGITLGSGNLVRGLNVGNTSGVGITDSGLTVGSLTISEVSISGTGGGFEADNGGTLNVSFTSLSASSSTDEGIHINAAGSFNTSTGSISTTGIPAVVIDGNATIALGVTLQSVSSSTGANTGITIQDTTGTFTVAGTGSAGTGGTIANKTGGDGSTTAGIGIYLNNAQNINLNDMQLNDFQNFAILGNNVTGFTFADSVVNGSNGNSAAQDEGSISFDNLLGTVSFSNSSISGAYEDNINVVNTTGTLNMSVSGSTIGLNHVNFGNDGILVESQSNATLNLTVSGTSFLGARGDMIQCNALGTSTMDCTITDNTFNNTHSNSLGGGITISGGSATSNINLSYDISGTSQGAQTFRGAVASAITANIINGNGIAHGFIRNNDIGVSGIANSGSSTGSGISVGTAVDVEHRVLIDNNDIVRVNGSTGMIDLISNVSASPSDGLYATVTNNNINEASGFIFAGVYTMSGGSHSGGSPDSSHICLDMRSNTINVSATFGLDYFIDKIGGSPATYYFPGFGGSSGGAALDTFLAGQNTLNSGGGDSSSATTLSGSGTQCVQPVASAPQDSGILVVKNQSDQILAEKQNRTEMASLSPEPLMADNQADNHTIATDFNAKPETLAKPALSGETINLALGLLNPGQVVVITFDVTVDSPFPSATSQVCNQGLFTADNFANLFTDDPAVGGASDPTCTPVEQPAVGTINIIKDTVPDAAQDFSFTTTGGLTPATFDLDDDADGTLSNTQSFTNVTPGAYTVTETAVSGYTTTLSCVDPDNGTTTASSTANIDLDAGETVTCTFTNTAQPGTIVIIKDTVPDGPQDFSFTATGGLTPATFDLDDDADGTLSNTQTFNNVASGAYSVTEAATAGYTTTLSCVDPSGGTTTAGSSANIDLAPGETVTCTFTNTIQTGTLTVIKNVVNDNGGTAVPSSFTMNVTGNNPSQASFPGSDSGVAITLEPGAYSVSETGPAGYAATFSADCLGTIAAGENKTCTVTNDDIQPTITVNKVLLPATDSGTFDLLIDNVVYVTGGDGATTGAVALNAGSYTVSEQGANGTNLAHYTTVIGGDCAADGTITVDIGENAVCTITNTVKLIYVSTQTYGQVDEGKKYVNDEDIISYEEASDYWDMVFDGSELYLEQHDIDAFHFLPDGSILMSFDSPIWLTGIGNVDDSDIVRFIPTQLGHKTSGTFELYFDGSDVGLTQGAEDIDALSVAPDGRLVISTNGAFDVPGVIGNGHDLIVFNDTSLGSTTSGTFELYFDGSDVDLTERGENIWGVWIDPATNDIYLTTKGGFSVAGLSGKGDDIFICAPSSLGTNSACSSFTLFFDGVGAGLNKKLKLDGIHIQ